MNARWLTLVLAALPALSAAENSVLIRNATVHPVSRAVMDNASVLVIDGKIAEVGAKVSPRGKVRIVEGKGLHVYPGLIDCGSLVGLSEIGSVRESGDTDEIGAYNPQLRSAIAVNPSSAHIPVTRANGITTVLALPAPPQGAPNRGVIAGQAGLMHLAGWTWEEMALKKSAVLEMRFPEIQTRSFNVSRMSREERPFAEAKRERDRALLELNEFFESARRYQAAKKANVADLKVDLKLEAMLPVLDGTLPVIVAAEREREIKEVFAFADKQKLKVVLANVQDPGETVAEIAKRKIPVILGTPFRPIEEDDHPYDDTFSLAGRLHKAGVKVAFASFDEQFSRNLPFEAGQSVAFGLPAEEGLKAVTLNAAEILGVADQTGSIDPGKWGDLIVTDGDPLEVKTHVKMMFIKGESVSLESKHTELYKRYMDRP